jgi:hypothetical protein
MSKDIEVGDVWKHKKTKHWFMVTFYPEDPNDKWYSIIWDNGYAEKLSKYYQIDWYNTYIGKSKGKISDLFKTESE